MADDFELDRHGRAHVAASLGAAGHTDADLDIAVLTPGSAQQSSPSLFGVLRPDELKAEQAIFGERLQAFGFLTAGLVVDGRNAGEGKAVEVELERLLGLLGFFSKLLDSFHVQGEPISEADSVRLGIDPDLAGGAHADLLDRGQGLRSLSRVSALRGRGRGRSVCLAGRRDRWRRRFVGGCRGGLGRSGEREEEENQRQGRPAKLRHEVSPRQVILLHRRISQPLFPWRRGPPATLFVMGLPLAVSGYEPLM